MDKFSFIVLLVLSTFISSSYAQQSPSPESKSQSQQAPEGTLMPAIPDYKHAKLTGDWGGVRTDWAEKGITLDINVTQILQGNAHGGKDTNGAIAYSGSTDYTVTFDTARLGLWPGGQLKLMGETQFGHSINGKVGSIMAPNADALFPMPDDSGITTLTNVVYTQFFSEHFGIFFGRIDFRGGDANVFAHDERTQFMNIAFVGNPVVLPVAPYTALNAGFIIRPTDWLMVVTSVLDSHGQPKESGFNTAFHSPQGTTVLQEWTFTIKPFGLEGHQRFGWAYSNKDSNILESDRRIGLRRPLTLRLLRNKPLLKIARLARIPASLGNPDTKPDDWCIYYNFDQYLYTEPEDPTQGIGIFGRFGWSNGEANPIEEFYSLGVGGKGIIPERDNDTFGVGYYHINMSDDLPGFLNIDAEQGAELYYNIEVAPWLHITPDIQVIVNPGGGDNDVAVAYGLRAQMNF